MRQGTIAELTAGSDVVVVRTPTPDPLAAAVSSDGGTVGSGRCPVGESIRSTTATSPKAWPIATSRSVSTSGCASSRCAATRATTSRRRLTTAAEIVAIMVRFGPGGMAERRSAARIVHDRS